MNKRQLFGTVLAAYLTGRLVCSLSRAVANGTTMTILEHNPKVREFLRHQHDKEQAIKNEVWPN